MLCSDSIPSFVGIHSVILHFSVSSWLEHLITVFQVLCLLITHLRHFTFFGQSEREKKGEIIAKLNLGLA